MYYVVIFIIVL